MMRSRLRAQSSPLTSHASGMISRARRSSPSSKLSTMLCSWRDAGVRAAFCRSRSFPLVHRAWSARVILSGATLAWSEPNQEWQAGSLADDVGVCDFGATSVLRDFMTTSRSAIAAIVLTLCSRLAIAPAPISAQEVRSDTLLTVGHYLDFEQVAEPRISPDGRQVIYTRRWVNALEDKWESALWLMNSDGSHNRFLVKGANAVWSPDGNRIAYLADGEPKGTQIFVRWMDTEGASTQITRVAEAPADIK